MAHAPGREQPKSRQIARILQASLCPLNQWKRKAPAGTRAKVDKVKSDETPGFFSLILSAGLAYNAGRCQQETV